MEIIILIIAIVSIIISDKIFGKNPKRYLYFYLIPSLISIVIILFSYFYIKSIDYKQTGCVSAPNCFDCCGGPPSLRIDFELIVRFTRTIVGGISLVFHSIAFIVILVKKIFSYRSKIKITNVQFISTLIISSLIILIATFLL